MKNRIFTRFTCALLFFVFVATPVAAAIHDRERDEPISVRERLVRLVKKIPRPSLPKILDDTVVPPKP
ncbi:MAG: hypothetical protein QOE68_4133 [Thermoanaerobaculia bacterium]|jgi:hypothetical protein|nr:hypothetical protein [Thermoanaerobaculia bacterium]